MVLPAGVAKGILGEIIRNCVCWPNILVGMRCLLYVAITIS